MEENSLPPPISPSHLLFPNPHPSHFSPPPYALPPQTHIPSVSPPPAPPTPSLGKMWDSSPLVV